MRRRSASHSDLEMLRESRLLLRKLDLPQPCSVDALCDQVQQARGRRLIILPLPFPASEQSPYGLWAEYPDADFILHEDRTSPAHKDQIILHEIAHILLGHGAAAGPTSSVSRASPQTVPDPSRQMPVAMNTRLAYGSIEERQAELIASLLLTRTSSVGARHTYNHSDLHALRPLWSRLTSAAPKIVLSPSLSSTDDLHIYGADLRLRVRRCIVEIRDAQLLLRGYVSDSSAATACAALADTGLTGKELEAATEAVWLRAATAIRRAGHPTARPASTRRLHGGADVLEEVRWLRLVAAAWNAPAVVSTATALLQA